MKILITVAFVLGLAGSAQAWDWFGLAKADSEAATNAPPRLHVLLVPANDAIEEAEDAALSGDADKAVAAYRKAIRELDRVEFENPERAEKPEFAPLRSKRATCLAAIDSLRFSQVDQNARAVAVTDTTELQKKYDAKHGKVKPKDDAREKKEEVAEKKAEVKKKEPKKVEVKKAEVEKKAEVVKKEEVKVTGTDDLAARYAMALREVKAKDYAAADLILEDLERQYPTNLKVLLLRAAAQSGQKSYYAARRTLERASRAHPKNYLPWRNLAYLTLRINERTARETARQYYEMSREFGGARDTRLEKELMTK